jgi:hypothetical protein
MDAQLEQQQAKKPFFGFRDMWQLLIKLIIALLVIAWFINEYIRDKELDLISLIILIILLAIIIWLILKQRHFILLQCNLTEPTNCVNGDPNILSGRILEPVEGGAYGWGFRNYLIELRDPGANLLSDVIVYPDGGGSPDPSLTQGNMPITSGTLGWIDVEKAASDAGSLLLTSTTFEVTLRVYGVDGSEGATCKTSFNVSINEVYIKRVSSPWSVNYDDPDEPLRRSDNAASELATIGGLMHVRGVANVYGCAGEKIQEYKIWAIPDPGFAFAQPAPFTSVTPGADWVEVAHVTFGPQTIDGIAYSADDVRNYNVLDGKPDPDVLTNNWETRKECISIIIDSILHKHCWKVPDLKAKEFDSKAKLGTGKFTFLLQVIDTLGKQYYDIQRAWIDNEQEVGEITGIAGLLKCEDLYTQNSDGTFKVVDIEGTAWDPLIDSSDLTKPTSDNFDRYEVKFQKHGASSEAVLITSNSPVPPRPDPIGVGILTKWNLETVNAATNPLGLPADQLLKSGERCPYDVILRVYDLTVVNEIDPRYHYSGKITFPVSVINAPEPSP